MPSTRLCFPKMGHGRGGGVFSSSTPGISGVSLCPSSKLSRAPSSLIPHIPTRGLGKREGWEGVRVGGKKGRRRGRDWEGLKKVLPSSRVGELDFGELKRPHVRHSDVENDAKTDKVTESKRDDQR